MNPELRVRLGDVTWDALSLNRIPAYEFPSGDKALVVSLTRYQDSVVTETKVIEKDPEEPWIEPPWSCSMTFDEASEVISSVILGDTSFPRVIVGYGFKEATPGEVCIILAMTEALKKSTNPGIPPDWFLRHEREKDPTVWDRLGTIVDDE